MSPSLIIGSLWVGKMQAHSVVVRDVHLSNEKLQTQQLTARKDIQRYTETGNTPS